MPDTVKKSPPAHAPSGATTSGSSDIDKILDDVIALPVAVPDKAPVYEYLSAHKDIAQLLPQVCLITRDKFPSPSRLALEVFHNREVDDRYLVLFVRQENYEQKIMDKFEQIDERIGTLLSDSSGFLLVTTDFKKPGK